MIIPFTYIVRDRDNVNKIIRITYIPNDGRLTTFRKTFDSDPLTPVSSETEVDQFVKDRAPMGEWDAELYKVDTTYREQKDADIAAMHKRMNVVTL